MTDNQYNLLSYGVKVLRPKPKLTGSEWADKYYYLSSETSGKPGKWYTYPWQKEILDAMTDNISHFVFFLKPTRVGFTKLITITKAYFIHQKPRVQLSYHPTDDEAKGYAEDELSTMLRDNTIVQELVAAPPVIGKKLAEKTIKKIYPSGYLEILGAYTDRNFDRRTAGVTYADELDAWEMVSKKAGNRVLQMFRRTSDRWDRKNILGGKPMGASYNPDNDIFGQDGISQSHYWYIRGTQEKRQLPCPHCGHMQFFEFEDFIWDKEVDEEGHVIKHYPETVHFLCEECKEKILHKHLRKMDKGGKWVATNNTPKRKARSFYIWAMLSYSPNVTWSDIVYEFLDASRDPARLRTFYNEVLARPFDEDLTYLNTKGLIDRKEDYGSDIPKGVLVLSLGADVQKDRIECAIIGWGKDFESWAIDYKIFQGDTRQPEVWKVFKTFILGKRWTNYRGNQVLIYTGCIDAGYRTETVTSQIEPLFDRGFFATKGANTATAPIVPRKASKTKNKRPLFIIGINRGKDEIAWHIKSSGGAGYMHFPNLDIYNHEYFAQLGAEVRSKTGIWKAKRKRNEVFDCTNYSRIALDLKGIDLEVLGLNGTCLGEIFPAKTKKEAQQLSYLDKY